MEYYGNSTGGVDQGQDIPDDEDEDDGWECPHCGHIIFVASASSIEDGGEIIGGITCPECEEFISDDELGIESEEN